MRAAGSHRRVAEADEPERLVIPRDTDPVYQLLVRIEGIVVGADVALLHYQGRLEALERAATLSAQLVGLVGDAEDLVRAILPAEPGPGSRTPTSAT